MTYQEKEEMAIMQHETNKSSADLRESYIMRKESTAQTIFDEDGTGALEQTPLLTKEHNRTESSWGDTISNEVKAMIELALPVTGTYILEMLPGIVSIVLVGHLGHEKRQIFMDATSMSTVLMNLTGMATGIGMTTAMDTLCSQAYGAQETQRIGIYLQTGIIILSVAYLGVFLVNFYSGEILIMLGQPHEVSEMAGLFSRFLLPGIPFIYLYELLRKILQANNIVIPMLQIALVANVINVVLGYYLVYYTSWGFLGAAIARTVCNVACPVLLLPYMYWIGVLDEVWTGVQLREALAGLNEFLILGTAGMMQVCFEWWAFEIIYIFCGWMPNAEVSIGTNSIVMNITSMCYMIYLGISVSASIRIGNALGAGLPHQASLTSRVALAISFSLSLFVATNLVTFRHYIPQLFTTDPAIDSLAESLGFVTASLQIPDSMNVVVQGALRGSGRQSLGAKLNFSAYYLLGIPFGSVLAFSFHKGLEGMWIGLSAALSTIAIVGVFIIQTSDWNLLAEQAKQRIHGNDNIIDVCISINV